MNLPGGFGVGGVGGKGVVVGTANEKRKSFLLKYHLLKKSTNRKENASLASRQEKKNSNVRFSESNISTVSNSDPIVTHYKHSGPTSSMRKGILTAGNAPVSGELLQRKTVGKQHYFIEITAVSPCEPKRLL